MAGAWRDHREHPLDAESLRRLFDNEIACIRVQGFASPEESRAFADAMDAVGLAHEYRAIGSDVRARPKYLGVPQFEYRKKTKADYFAAVERAYAERAAVFARCGFDPIGRLMALLRRTLPGRKVRLAEEPGFGRYYAGIVRETTGGTNLHFDFARFSAPDYAIAANDAQIATNFYASRTDAGGETTVYNLHFEPGVPRGAYYEISPFDKARVEGAERIAFKPAAGDLVMFNARCPPPVAWNPRERGQRRPGIGCFVGRTPEGDLVLWS